MAIWFETKLEKIPENCKDCKCHWCSLPLKKSYYGYADELKKKYITQRHEDCPLKIKED